MTLQASENGYNAMILAVEVLPHSFRGCRDAIAQKAIELFDDLVEEIVGTFYAIEIELGTPHSVALAMAEALYDRRIKV